MTTTSIYVCMSCGEILHSKHDHDFVSCNCYNAAFVDARGGRRGAKALAALKPCITISEAKRVSYACTNVKKMFPPKKRTSQPPPFFNLHDEWQQHPNAKHQRFGQWFVSQYMPQSSGSDIDILWNTNDPYVAIKIIHGFYKRYQWQTA